jgi:CRP/FNR family cyclic AMP-dependent transcriptional regulator
MFAHLNQYMQQCVTLSEEELEVLNSFFVRKEIPKKTFLLQEGDICSFESFVEKGCIKTYYLDENGFEFILQLATENWWVSDIASFNERKPSKMYIETMEDSILLTISPEAKEKLLHTLPILERVFRVMLQRHVAVIQERLFANIALPAQTRYLQFLEKYPALQQRVPQHLIASYLGMSPEFLSRIRKRLSAKPN